MSKSFRNAGRVVCTLVFGLTATLLVTLAPGGAAAADFTLNFAGTPRDARAWLSSQGFQFLIDGGSTAKARFGLGEQGLTIETLTRAEPLIVRDKLSIRQPAVMTIKWGVSRFAEGANWDTGVNNEAVMVIVHYGTEKLPGGLFLPPSPYFIGFFLCRNERRGVAYTGRSYARQGRYICVDKPNAGTEVTTVLNLEEQFRSAFKSSGAVPTVTGIGIESDTTQVSGDGRASAWIRSISIAGP